MASIISFETSSLNNSTKVFSSRACFCADVNTKTSGGTSGFANSTDVAATTATAAVVGTTNLLKNMSSSESSVNSEEELEPSDIFERDLPRARRNDPDVCELWASGWWFVAEMTAEDWEQLGRDINDNTHLLSMTFSDVTLDDHKMSSLFRRLTRGNNIHSLTLDYNHFGADGVQSMAQFLQSASKLTSLDVSNNDIGSDGFNLLWRAVRDSPIGRLVCTDCGIDFIEIDDDHIPNNLYKLNLVNNNINADGYIELSKLLNGSNSTLKELELGSDYNHDNVDDECLGILANALQNNKSLDSLSLSGNGITTEGKKILMKLVNDMSSIKATLQSNHRLRFVRWKVPDNPFDETENLICAALGVNQTNYLNPAAAGKTKVIYTQLNSRARSQCCLSQGIDQCNAVLYSQIDPLHLPEVLALISKHLGQRELYLAVKSTIATLFSTVNEKEWIKQQMAHHVEQMAHHASIIKEHKSKCDILQSKLATLEDAEIEYRSSKRPRT